MAEDTPVQIPDLDTLHADLTGLKYSYDSNTRLRLEKKEDMKKRGLRSPDEGDALALTFALPVRDPKRDQREDPRAQILAHQRCRPLATKLLATARSTPALFPLDADARSPASMT